MRSLVLVSATLKSNQDWSVHVLKTKNCYLCCLSKKET